MKRNCHTCLHKDSLEVLATHVATDEEGLSWYECGRHGPRDNVARTKRAKLEPIELWASRNGLAVGDGS